MLIAVLGPALLTFAGSSVGELEALRRDVGGQLSTLVDGVLPGDIFGHATPGGGDMPRPTEMRLRVTELFRREGGAWKLFHRHADRLEPGDGA